MQPQTFGNDLRLVPTHERSLDTDITARAEYDGVVHRIYEFLAAVGIGIAGGIVVMCTVVNHAAVLGQRNACRCRQEQTVAERHIGRNRLAAALRQLLGVGFLGDVLGRVGKQRAVAVREHRRQVERCALDAVVFENRLCSLDLLNVLLTVVNGQRTHILLAVLLDGKRKTGRAVHAAAAQDHCFFAHRLSTFSGYRSWWVRRSNATSSQRVPGLP